MACKTVLTLTAIQKYFADYYNHALERGENGLESGHLKSFSYDGELSAIAVVQSSQKSAFYNVQIDFARDRVIKASCTCTRGKVNCHHIMCAMLHAHRNVSVTDKACSWSLRKKPEDKNVIRPIDDVRSRKKKKRKNGNKENVQQQQQQQKKHNTSAAPVGLSLSDLPTKEFLNEIKKDIRENCKGAATHLLWLLSEEPALTDETIYNYDNDNVEIHVMHPHDVILTQDYAQAENKENFLVSYLGLGWDSIVQIAEATKGQYANPLWTVMRQWKLTASNFGDILHCYKKRNGPTPAQSLLQNLYKPKDLSRVRIIQWGITNEKLVRDTFQAKYGLKVDETGLWLHECGFLGASPDGLIGSDSTLEIKCPYKYRNSELKKELASDLKYLCRYVNGSWIVDKDHEYYHQIQAQLMFTNRQKCFVVLYTTKSFECFIIKRDEEWAKNIFLLKKFYVDYFVPYVREKQLAN